MSNRQIRVIVIYMLMTGLCMFALGRSIGVEQQLKEYNELKQDYDILEIQYKRDLEDCQTMFGDYQDKVEAGCFVNGGWNCE